jgi:hypothetical protein
MTKKLEELLNLESISEAVEKTEEKSPPIHQQITTVNETIEAVEQITRGLPQIQELNDLGDGELDELSRKAEQAYDDLMDLGMNVEVRYAGRIFEVASSMMGNAIAAKTAKIDKKLKAVDLQLKKLKIEKDANEDPNDVLNGQGYVITDRNELLKKLGAKD